MRYFLTKNLHLIIIVALALALRFYQLGQNPPGLFMDEASNGYNAYSILKTTRDQYGNFLPLTIRAFGDYNPALSVYLLIPSIAVFGLNEFAVRFPSALLGTLTVFLTYLLARVLFKKDSIALLCAFFLAISPWHIQFSRYGHEANFMLFFVVLGIASFLYALKNHLYLSLSAFSFALALNSYQGAKILVPVILLLLFIIYIKEIFNFKFKLILPVIILLLSTLPIVLNFKNSLVRGQSVGILSQDYPAKTFVSNYLSHFSPKFLFVEGDNIGRHSVSGMGELYVFQLPLIILGILSIIKLEGKSKSLILGLLLISPIPASLTMPAPHALRSILFAPVWSIIAALGMVRLFSKTAIISLLAVLGLYNFATYLHLYYKHEPKLKAADWQDGYKEMVKYVDGVEENYNSIAITNYFGHSYIFFLFYTRYDPNIYHPQSEEKLALGKYEFFSASWEKTKPGKALVVTPPWQAHPPDVIKEIYAKNGELKFVISETQ